MSERKLRYGSLFSGIGGLDLGMDRVGWKCAFQVEIDEYARKVLEHHWPDVPKFADVRDFPPKDQKFDVDLLAGGFPCFPAGTLVDTADGLKPIEDIQVGERVLTHKNRLRKVTETMSRTTNDMVEIRAFGHLPFKTTPEHPFLVVRRSYVRSGKYGNLSPVFSKPFWANASELDKNHFLAQPIYRPRSKRQWEPPAFWHLIGRYLGDGWIVNYKRKSKIPQGRRGSRVNSRTWKIIVCGKYDEEQEIKNIIINAGFHACIARERTVIKFHICSKSLVEFLEPFGRGAHNKTIPEWVFSAPQEHLKALWQGVKESDGCIRPNGAVEYSSVSKKLALNTQRLARIVTNKPSGFYPVNKAGKAVIEGRTVNIRDSFSFRVSPKRTEGFSDGNHVWVPVREVKSIKEKNKVYNIGVEEDESYVASSYVVHNCKQVSNARTAQVAVPEGLKGKDSGLWFEMRRIIRAMEPRWVVIENVGALSTRGLETVLWQMVELGYDCTWTCLSAAALGAPHLRKRIFVVAVQNTYGEGLERHVREILAQPNGWRQDADAARSNWGDTPPRLCGNAHGVPPRLVHARPRLTALGNAVVPAVGEFIGRRILEADAKLFK